MPWHCCNRDKVDMDDQDIDLITRRVWRGRSAISGKGMHAGTGRLILSRWDPATPATLNNTVLLTKDEAKTHAVSGTCSVVISECCNAE